MQGANALRFLTAEMDEDARKNPALGEVQQWLLLAAVWRTHGGWKGERMKFVFFLKRSLYDVLARRCSLSYARASSSAPHAACSLISVALGDLNALHARQYIGLAAGKFVLKINSFGTFVFKINISFRKSDKAPVCPFHLFSTPWCSPAILQAAQLLLNFLATS